MYKSNKAYRYRLLTSQYYIPMLPVAKSERFKSEILHAFL